MVVFWFSLKKCWSPLSRHQFLQGFLFDWDLSQSWFSAAYLGQHVNVSRWRPLMNLDDSVDDWNVSSIDIENHYLPCSDRLLAHIEKQDVPPIEPWLHASTQNNNHLQNLFAEIRICIGDLPGNVNRNRCFKYSDIRALGPERAHR